MKLNFLCTWSSERSYKRNLRKINHNSIKYIEIWKNIFKISHFLSQKFILPCLEKKIFLKNVDFFYFRSHERSELLAHAFFHLLKKSRTKKFNFFFQFLSFERSELQAHYNINLSKNSWNKSLFLASKVSRPLNELSQYLLNYLNKKTSLTTLIFFEN